jgi:nucleotide-binding universal stress UspA family protein
MYLRIVVATDGSACSDECAVHAVAIAKVMGLAVVFLFVMDTLRGWHEGVVNTTEALQTLTIQGRSTLDRAEEAAFNAGVGARGELVEGTAVDVIVHRSADFDLVVMGSRGKGLLERLTVGSVTEAVLHRIGRPLLVVRRDNVAQVSG